MKYLLEKLKLLKENLTDRAIFFSNLPYGKRIDKKQTKTLSISAIIKVFSDFDCDKHFLTSMKFLSSILKFKETSRRRFYNSKIEVILFS